MSGDDSNQSRHVVQQVRHQKNPQQLNIQAVYLCTRQTTRQISLVYRARPQAAAYFTRWPPNHGARRQTSHLIHQRDAPRAASTNTELSPPSSPNITTTINQHPSFISGSQHPSPGNTSRHAMAPEFHAVTPILRIFDVPKADEFYLEYLGFTIDWEHRHDANAPLYRQISHGALTLHLSEHHGDGSPGARLRISTSNLAEYHAALTAKRYRYMRPGLEDGPAEGSHEMTVLDPFGNTLIFCQEAK